jgi:4-oxalocrotonate tautomerase
MPVTRIAIRDGRAPEYEQALMDEIYEAMRETIAIKKGDRFMAITEHGDTEFACGPFLGIDRSDDLVQLQVLWARGKTIDAKLAMYKKIVERLGINPCVRPEDVLVSVVETAAENSQRTGRSATAGRSSKRPPIMCERLDETPPISEACRELHPSGQERAICPNAGRWYRPPRDHHLLLQIETAASDELADELPLLKKGVWLRASRRGSSLVTDLA